MEVILRVIDLRSDTVTQPTEAMRKAMAKAEVGDDVLGEDPTIIRLEQISADMMSKESALFTPSGTMSNLVAVLTHCDRGDEVIMGNQAHMFWNEAGGGSTLAGVQVHLVPNDRQGRLDPADVEAAIRSEGNFHFPPTGLLCLENSHNRCNGGVLTPGDTKATADVAHKYGVPVHLDGARIFNSAVYLGTSPKELVAEVADVCFCLSKGLSAPVGSVLCGSREFVDKARKWRKMLGGGMRQAGVLAAAGIVALETMIDRLEDDHVNARRLAEGIAQIPGIEVDPWQVKTNIVFGELELSGGSVQEFIGMLAKEGVKVSYPGGRKFRLVTHRHITAGDVDAIIDIMGKTTKGIRRVVDTSPASTEQRRS